MGNALLRLICGRCCSASDQSFGHHGVTHSTAGISALAQDLLRFDSTSQVPEGLSQHVVSSKKAQANWYTKLWEAWREANPPPRTPEEAAQLIVLTLKGHQHADVEGLLAFYGFALPGKIDPEEISPASPAVTAAAKPQGFKFELDTLPVDVKSIADGDTVTVYVSTADPRESSVVPREVHKAATARTKARAAKDYTKADALHKTIIQAGYRFIPGANGEETLAKKYRIRLSGIDSPESAMPYGKEAKEEMVNLVLGQPLKVYVYTTDRYGRCVGDIYCNGIFVQEAMLKKGMAWHYTAYDKRPELAMWQKQAQAARVGLWASKNPVKPWEWRKERRNGA